LVIHLKKGSDLNATIKKVTSEANFLSLAGNISISLFGFAGFALLVRSFPPEVFGHWVLYLASAALVDMFRFGITTTAIIRFLSGSKDEEWQKLVGSFILIVILATAGIAVIVWTCHLAFPVPIAHAGYDLFFLWYPLMMLTNIPFNTATIILQAELQFSKILLINSIYSIGFFIVVLMNFLFFRMGLTQIVLAQLGINAVASVICLANGWDGLKYLRKATRRTNKILLDFGKYTTFTLIGTNLLRSADTLIISLSPMGTAAVALYSIPMKLVELQQIPLRSFAATAFPKMSKESLLGRVREVRELFYNYAGAMTYLFAFISLITFVFAEYLVMILGGHQYLGIDPATGASTVMIVRIFSIYGMLLPIERMTGIGLDSVNRPDRNFQKVLYMTIANVIGDLVAVFIFKSLAGVAIGSVLFTIMGIWIGAYFLDKEIGLVPKKIFSSGIDFYRMIYHSFRDWGKSRVLDYEHNQKDLLK
jgi:O-antigen/teichoic acid export membrane protein